MDRSDLPLLAPMRDAYEAARGVRSFADLEHVLDGVAALLTGELGWSRAVIHAHREAWDPFVVVAAVGDTEEAVGACREWAEWAPMLGERRARRGAYVVPSGDGLVVVLRGGDGEPNGMLS